MVELSRWENECNRCSCLSGGVVKCTRELCAKKCKDEQGYTHQVLREAIIAKKSQNCGLFPYGGGAQPHSIAFGGVFPNIIEAIFVDEISTK